ncbi:uncharacterized protein [Pyrus communis]|uniref:uncharacterized protein n=1 Tax=Pyrus communis TaxID=23211 RepID=UPI0035C0AC57
MPLCIQYPRAAPDKTDEFELKFSLLHHIPKFHGLSMEDPNKHLKEFEHQMKEELLLQYFYEGLLPTERQMLDASEGGALVDKTPMAAKTLIANRALNAEQYEGVGQRDIPRQQQVNEGMQNRDKKVDELDKQVGQIAEFMGQFREQGKLPSSTVVNPKGGFESGKAIKFRSGKQVGTASQPSKSTPTEDEKLQFEEEEQEQATARFMTKSSKPVRKHILDFDDDFERTLRKQKNQQNPNPPSFSSTSEFDEGGEEGEATTQFVEEVQTMVVDNRTIKELSASGMDNAVPLCIQYPAAGQVELLIQYFYEGLLPMERQMLDASVGGALMDKTPVDAKTLIANRAHNAQQYEGVGQREGPRQQSVNEGQEKQTKDMHNYANEVQNQAREVTELKRQVGQMAEFMGQFSREQGKLPRSTQVNPKGGFESAKAISLRSGKQVGSDHGPSKPRSNEEEELRIEEEEQSLPTAKVETPLPQALNDSKTSNQSIKGKNVSSSVPTNVFPPNVPFPSKFMQPKKEEAEKDILETSRKVQVNIPLLDAIKQVPRY